MSELIINKKSEKTEVCILEDGKICEIYLYGENKENITGNIYMGKVRNVVEGMQAAFVDIGMEKNAFISLKDASPKVNIAKGEKLEFSKISEVLKQNDDIIVQVKKAATPTKGARVSTHISIPGNYLVLLPNVEIITVSQKISENERERVLKIIRNSLPEGYGAIARTEAELATERIIKEEINHLVKQWENIVNKSKEIKSIGLLYDEHELVSKVGRELINNKIEKIYVNDDKIYDELREYIDQKKENMIFEIKILNVSDIISEFGLLSEISEANERKVWLKNGGYIVIDKTEALTAIDVNSGKFLGENGLENTAFAVNSEAAKEIMKQLRLRDIGGIIVIDYIDLTKKENQFKIIKIMEEEAKKDRSKIDIKGYTELNLVELTRKMKNI